MSNDIQLPYDVDIVTRAYLGTQLWTGHYYPSDDAEPEPLDDHVETADDLPYDIRTEARADVVDFLGMVKDAGLMSATLEHWDDEQLGHDLSLTRNRHGAGFWDRGHGELGDALTALAESLGESYLLGDPSGIYAD